MKIERCRILGGVALALMTALGSVGCKTAHITHASTAPELLRIGKADTILVKSFDASKATFKGDLSEANVLNDADRQRISQIIVAATLHHLAENGYTGKAFTTDGPAGALIVEGTVTEVDKGSYSKRFLIGMGAGAAFIKANVILRSAGNPDAPLAKLVLVGKGGITGGMRANQDWIGIYSAGLGHAVADFLMGKRDK